MCTFEEYMSLCSSTQKSEHLLYNIRAHHYLVTIHKVQVVCLQREIVEPASPCEGSSSVRGFGLVIKVVVTEQSLWRIVSPRL